ncbi:unnamed protein product, partial [Bubo scandiacus]
QRPTKKDEEQHRDAEKNLGWAKCSGEDGGQREEKRDRQRGSDGERNKRWSMRKDRNREQDRDE